MVRACGRARRGPGASDGAAVSGALGGCHDRSSFAADGAGTDAEHPRSQHLRSSMPLLALLLLRPGGRATCRRATSPPQARGGAAGEGETAGDESFEGVRDFCCRELEGRAFTAGLAPYSGANVELPPRTGTLFPAVAHRSGGRGLPHASPRLRLARFDAANGGRTPRTNVSVMAGARLRQRCPEVAVISAWRTVIGDAASPSLLAFRHPDGLGCSRGTWAGCRYEHPDQHGQWCSALRPFRPRPEARCLPRGVYETSRRGRCARRADDPCRRSPAVHSATTQSSPTPRAITQSPRWARSSCSTFPMAGSPLARTCGSARRLATACRSGARRQRQRPFRLFRRATCSRSTSPTEFAPRARMCACGLERHRPIVRLQPVREHVRRRHLRACAFERQGYRPRRVRRIDRIGCQRAGSHE